MSFSRDSCIPPARTRTLTVDSAVAGQRLDSFLADTIASLSRSFLRKLIDEHQVLVNGASARASYKIRGGDELVVYEPPPEPAEPQAQDIPVPFLYQDEDILVIDKPAGLVVHPAPGCPDGTLVNALLHHCDDLSGVGGVIRPGIVHRLDRGTSGVMVVSKNDRAHRHLAAQFAEHTVRKKYLAFAARRPGAKPLPNQCRLETLFGRHPVHRKRFSSKVTKGKSAISEFRLLRKFEGSNWSAVKVEVALETGRTHQIRVHLADADHPILGDKLYGGRSARVFPAEILPARQALHAWTLSFQHPRTDKIVSFEAELPEDMVKLENLLAQGPFKPGS